MVRRENTAERNLGRGKKRERKVGGGEKRNTGQGKRAEMKGGHEGEKGEKE